jgi:hypothetical protein
MLFSIYLHTPRARAGLPAPFPLIGGWCFFITLETHIRIDHRADKRHPHTHIHTSTHFTQRSPERTHRWAYARPGRDHNQLYSFIALLCSNCFPLLGPFVVHKSLFFSYHFGRSFGFSSAP